MRRITLTLFGILLALFGLIWFFQGINLLPGSFMTGQIQWAIYGVIAFLAGAALLWFTNRTKSTPPKS